MINSPVFLDFNGPNLTNCYVFNYKLSVSVGLLMTDVVTSRSAVLKVLVKPYKEGDLANII